MKTLKLFTVIAALMLFSASKGYSTVLQYDITVTISGIDYGRGIGVVTGTYVYRFTIKLSSEGYIANMHWNVIESNLINEKGDRVIIVDSGHDNLGGFWEIWNNINAWNEGWNIYYDIENGWLDGIMPENMPATGSFVNLSCKIICKGVVVKMPIKLVIHSDGKGGISATAIV